MVPDDPAFFLPSAAAQLSWTLLYFACLSVSCL